MTVKARIPADRCVLCDSSLAECSCAFVGWYSTCLAGSAEQALIVDTLQITSEYPTRVRLYVLDSATGKQSMLFWDHPMLKAEVLYTEPRVPLRVGEFLYLDADEPLEVHIKTTPVS